MKKKEHIRSTEVLIKRCGKPLDHVQFLENLRENAREKNKEEK